MALILMMSPVLEEQKDLLLNISQAKRLSMHLPCFASMFVTSAKVVWFFARLAAPLVEKEVGKGTLDVGEGGTVVSLLWLMELLVSCRRDVNGSSGSLLDAMLGMNVLGPGSKSMMLSMTSSLLWPSERLLNL